jgi:hypothetical protein
MRPPIWVQVRTSGLQYGARTHAAGDVVAMAPLDAVTAHRRGEVSLTRPSAVAIAAALVRMAEPPPVVAAVAADAPARRRYRRRDLEPEP